MHVQKRKKEEKTTWLKLDKFGKKSEKNLSSAELVELAFATLTTLHFTALLHYTTLHYTALQFTFLDYTALHYSGVQPGLQ